MIDAGRDVKLSDADLDEWFAATWSWAAFRSARSEPAIQDAHTKLSESRVKVDQFKRSDCALKTKPRSQFVLEGVYYVQGISFLVFEEPFTGHCEGYDLDQSAIEQVCECITSLAGFETYFRNYKLSGKTHTMSGPVMKTFLDHVDWLGSEMFSHPQAQDLAKHCKLAVTIMANPPPPGGGGVGSAPPPRFFWNNFFIYYCIDMKLGTPLRASIWRRLVQRKSKSAGNFLL